jgi:hypothetical protein
MAELVFDLPKGKGGLFTQPSKFDAKYEVGETHRRNDIAANHFKYADDLGAGVARTYDPEGRYNCGRCNQADGTKCLLVKIKRIDRQAGSCGDWEDIDAGDEEMVLHQKSIESAGYGIAKNGIGFGCIRCPFGEPAKVPDSLGRDWWCGKFAARTQTTACCALNGAPERPLDWRGDDADDDEFESGYRAMVKSRKSRRR